MTSQEIVQSLLSCPFCGRFLRRFDDDSPESKRSIAKVGAYFMHDRSVKESDCFFFSLIVYPEQISAWNKRNPSFSKVESELRLKIESLQEQVDALAGLFEDAMKLNEHEVCDESSGCGECDHKRTNNKELRSRLSAIMKPE